MAQGHTCACQWYFRFLLPFTVYTAVKFNHSLGIKALGLTRCKKHMLPYQRGENATEVWLYQFERMCFRRAITESNRLGCQSTIAHQKIGVYIYFHNIAWDKIQTPYQFHSFLSHA